MVRVACENATGESMEKYLKSRLFEPLGIENPTFQCDPQGRFYGATGMYLTVHELSLLGQLYLKRGYFFWINGDHFSISGEWGQKCLINNGNQSYVDTITLPYVDI